MIFLKNYKLITSKSCKFVINHSIRSLSTGTNKNNGLNKLSIEKLDLKNKRVLIR